MPCIFLNDHVWTEIGEYLSLDRKMRVFVKQCEKCKAISTEYEDEELKKKIKMTARQEKKPSETIKRSIAEKLARKAIDGLLNIQKKRPNGRMAVRVLTAKIINAWEQAEYIKS